MTRSSSMAKSMDREVRSTVNKRAKKVFIQFSCRRSVQRQENHTAAPPVLRCTDVQFRVSGMVEALGNRRAEFGLRVVGSHPCESPRRVARMGTGLMCQVQKSGIRDSSSRGLVASAL